MQSKSDFSQNLRHVVASVGTSASVCRDLGLNQQQFSKYVNGVSRPSPYNLRKLAQYFGLDDEDFDQPYHVFTQRFASPAPSGSRAPGDSLKQAFPGDLKTLRSFAGMYRVYYTSPAVPDKIVAAAMFLDERDGLIHTRSIESLRAEGERHRQWSRCEGQASYHGERLFVVDFEERNGGALSMTTLVPPHRYRQGLIFGMMFFLASFPRRTPHASRVVWQRAERGFTARELLQGCGIYSMTSLNVHPAVRRYLSEAATQMSIAPPFESED